MAGRKTQGSRSNRYRCTLRGDGLEERTPREATFPFPDLGALSPVVKPTPGECALWRLVAFYDVVRDAMGRDRYPHPCGVWLNPSDERQLRRWVEAPYRDASDQGGRRRRLDAYWEDKGPASSSLVLQGEIVVTRRAYSGPGSATNDASSSHVSEAGR